MPILMVIATVALYSLQALFCKLFSDHYPGAPQSSTRVFSICFGAFVALATWAMNGFAFNASWQTLLFGMGSAGSLLLYNLALINAAKRGSYAFTNIANVMGGILLPLFFTVIFLHRPMTWVQFMAIGIMLISLVLMNLRGLSFKGNANVIFYLWCLLLFTANGLYGIVVDAQQRTMMQTERNEMIIIGHALLAVFAFCSLYASRGKESWGDLKLNRRSGLFIVICCIFAVFAVNMQMRLLGQIPAPILYTITNGGSLVLAVVYAVLIFKEGVTVSKVTGVILAVISIVMLNLV